ncbi:hypothetical protein [Actinomadura nitritigenes]|uniref:hypothetical protein n=1 Tax=Actinomadura nitritigenes TaxID=134602 RepID=UPI001FB7F9C4|nr:hypothetical protein [Actinomadura nitritigenes]
MRLEHGPHEAARHNPGISAHEISLAKNRHTSIVELNRTWCGWRSRSAKAGFTQTPCCVG